MCPTFWIVRNYSHTFKSWGIKLFSKIFDRDQNKYLSKNKQIGLLWGKSGKSKAPLAPWTRPCALASMDEYYTSRSKENLFDSHG